MPRFDEPTLFAPDSGRHEPAVLTVSQLTALVKEALRSALPTTLHVRGEISNFKAHRSGHRYFTLKDSACELACVMWRSAARQLAFEPEDGMELVATGEIDLFERAGKYQLYVRYMEPTGVGALELAFRQLYERLKSEGLFDEVHKKPPPPYPAHIAIVTSPTGAAIRDMLQTIRRRFPGVVASLYPVPVQGDRAAGEIARALERINACNDRLGIDVIIVGRGGGAIEDLWAFNTEIVARAIFQSAVPVVSAVGHEIDLTISDLVADLRAATPTAAAELVVPLREEVAGRLQQLAHRIRRNAVHGVTLAGQALAALRQREPFRAPLRLTEQRTQMLDGLQNRGEHALACGLSHRRQRVSDMGAAMLRVQPGRVLANRHNRAQEIRHRLDRALQHYLQRHERHANVLAQRLTRGSPAERLHILEQRLDWSAQLLRGRIAAALHLHRRNLDSLASQLKSVSHRRTLARGYSVTRRATTGRLVVSPAELVPGDRVQTETANGTFDSVVGAGEPRQMDLFSAP